MRASPQSHPPRPAVRDARAPSASLRSRPLPIQAKLTVSAPGDRFEQEADRVADAVMSGPGAQVGPVSRGVLPGLYRVEMRPEDVYDSALPSGDEPGAASPEPAPAEEVRRSAAGEAGEVSPQFERSLQRAVGRGGEALPAATRSLMGSRMGWDFSSVRVHADAQADTLARAVNARAFTLGSDVFFARSEYRPGSPEGQRLLAHELTHVVQQSDGRLSRQIQRATRCSAYPGHDAGRDIATYNCAGLALRNYRFISPPSAVYDAIAADFISPSTTPTGDCGPGQVKFWLWEYEMHAEDDTGAVLSPAHHDFHIVGGRTDSSGGDPSDVLSKNGLRPVKGPGTGPSFRPPPRERNTTNNASETPTSHNGRPVFKVRTNMTEHLTCADCHP